MTATLLPLGHDPEPPGTRQEQIAIEIRTQMARRHVTQADLADALGITGPTLSKRLHNKQPMTVGFLEQVEQCLDLRVFASTPPDPGTNSGCSLTGLATVIPFPLTRHAVSIPEAA